MSIINILSFELNERKLKKQWRKNNQHNFTNIVHGNSKEYISVGNATYGTLNVHITSDKAKLKIGSYCSIADEVMFLLSSDHPLDRLSTYPFESMLLSKEYNEGQTKGDIVVGDDVWIGYRSTILSGVTIGQGAVIAAGSVVTKDVPPYTIVGGNPAKIIKYRFDEKTIKNMMKIDFSKLNKSDIEQNINILNGKLDDINKFDWLIKR